MKRRAAALFVALGALFSVGFVLAGSAQAHATVARSSPSDGSRLASAPAVVTITFDESIALSSTGYLHVIDAHGRRVDSGDSFHPGPDGATIADRLQPGLGDGTYIASYRVLSADSHPVAGTIRFVVGSGALNVSVGGVSAVNPRTSRLYDVARWMSFIGLALLGSAWLLLSIWPQGRADRRARRIVWYGWWAAAAGAALELLVQGPYTAGIVPDLGRWALLDATLHSAFGTFHCARLLLLAGLAVLLRIALHDERNHPRIAKFAAVLGAGIAVTFSATGHPRTTHPWPVSVALDTLHITAVATWVGGLIMLSAAVLPRREPTELRAVLPAFSRVAFTAVVVLVTTGSYAAWRGIGTTHALLATSYGRLVVVKIALLLGMLALGNKSRLVIQRRYVIPVAYAMTDAAVHDRFDEHYEDPLDDNLRTAETVSMCRSVRVEIALSVSILFVSAILVAQPRSKEITAIARQRSTSAVAELGSGRSATVTITPGRHGVVAADLSLGPGPRPTKITATASLPTKQIGPVPVNLARIDANTYAANGVNLPVAGDWLINLVVATSEFDAVTTQVSIHLN